MTAMQLTPAGPVSGRFRVPGSKSLSARAIITSALSDGICELPGILRCEDTKHLANALTLCGLMVSFEEETAGCMVQGLAGDFPNRAGQFDLGNAGTAMRFLTAVLTVAEGDYALDGTDRMRKRPIGKLVDGLNTLGADVKCTDGCPPVQIGYTRLKGGAISMAGNESSQFISGILLAAPYSEEGVTLTITGDVVSKPYLDLTCGVMADFGCPVSVAEDPLTFSVPPGEYKHCDWPVEPDASSASYFAAAAAVTGGDVVLEGLGDQSKQGDMACLDVLGQMGCTVTRSADETRIVGGALKGVTVDARDFPDMVPTLAAVAVFADGITEIRGVPHLRIKESDRIKSVATELSRFGARVEELDDGVRIHGGSKLTGAAIETWDDHRIAMSAAVVGLVVPDTVILKPGVVAKSYPDFFEHWPGAAGGS